jgi:uncharacterized integral membrane protein
MSRKYAVRKRSLFFRITLFNSEWRRHLFVFTWCNWQTQNFFFNNVISFIQMLSTMNPIGFSKYNFYSKGMWLRKKKESSIQLGSVNITQWIKLHHYITITFVIFYFVNTNHSSVEFRRKQWIYTYPIPGRWSMCTISYSIPRWRTAISCGQCRSSVHICMKFVQKLYSLFAWYRIFNITQRIKLHHYITIIFVIFYFVNTNHSSVEFRRKLTISMNILKE